MAAVVERNPDAARLTRLVLGDEGMVTPTESQVPPTQLPAAVPNQLVPEILAKHMADPVERAKLEKIVLGILGNHNVINGPARRDAARAGLQYAQDPAGKIYLAPAGTRVPREWRGVGPRGKRK